jgi:hypothetical protein
LSGREGRDARWMTLSCRSYIDALSANVQRVYSKTPKVPQCAYRVCRCCHLFSWFQLTSQHRTRERKSSTSDCFFLCSSSTYLRAPICEVVSTDGDEFARNGERQYSRGRTHLDSDGVVEEDTMSSWLVCGQHRCSIDAVRKLSAVLAT